MSPNLVLSTFLFEWDLMPKRHRLKWSSLGRREIRHRMEKIREKAGNLFHYPDFEFSTLLDFVMVPAVALRWKKENPLWCQVIGPPGSGKTAHLMLLGEWAWTKLISRLSKNSFISGYRDRHQPDLDKSLLPELDKRLLIIKDFTCILQGPKEERHAILGQMRDIYDGHCARHIGNLGLVEYESRFNIALGVTNIIDGYHAVSSQLGERFICRRLFIDKSRVKITRRAFYNVLFGKLSSAYMDLQEEIDEFLTLLPVIPMRSFNWNKPLVNKIIYGCDLISRCRSHVQRESNGFSISSTPSPEIGSRLVTQIVQSVSATALLHGKHTPTDDIWNISGSKILCDTLSGAHAWVLHHIYQLTVYMIQRRRLPRFTVRDLLTMTKLGYKTTRQIVTNLYFNGILEANYSKKGQRNTKYKLTDKAYRIIVGTNLFGSYEQEDVNVSLLRKTLRDKEKKQ